MEAPGGMEPCSTQGAGMEPVEWELLFQSSDASAPLGSAGCQPAGASKGEKQTGMAVAVCGAWAFHPPLAEENIYG